jgi:hypothetical protein
MTDTALDTTTAADKIAAQIGTQHHGLTVLELGEDGGTLVVIGHDTDRRTLAALNRYARTVWGEALNGLWGVGAPTADEVQRVRAIVVHGCDLGWGTEEPIPAAELELVDPDNNPCRECSRVGANWALLYRDDVQDHPAAFPVTVWEYDR